MNRFSLHALVLILIGGASACGPTEKEAQQACTDLASAFREAATGCSDSLDKLTVDSVGSLFSDVCDDVVDVNDMDGLYDVCIPWVRDNACKDPEGKNKPEECTEQFSLE